MSSRIPVGVYRHFRTNELYLCLGTSFDRTDDEDDNVVVYVGLYPAFDHNHVHRRTLENFTEIAEVKDGISTPRFILVHERVWSVELKGKYIGFVKAYLAMVKEE